MLPDRVSNPGPPTYESGVLPIALRGPAKYVVDLVYYKNKNSENIRRIKRQFFRFTQ